jgi:hypothetical protein
LFLLPISSDDLSSDDFHEFVLMNIVVLAIESEVSDSRDKSPRRTRQRFQDRVLLFMDGQREQVKAITDNAEELHARNIDVFRGIPATTARTQPLDNSQCFPILRHMLREGVAKLNQRSRDNQRKSPGRRARRSENEFFWDLGPDDDNPAWTREEFAVRDQTRQFLEASGNPLNAHDRKLLCHFMVELRKTLACMLSPHVVESGWKNAGLHPFNIRTILEHSSAFPELSEEEQARIEAKVKELAGDARYNGDLEPEEFWDLMPEEDKEAILCLNRPEIQRPFVNLTCNAEMERRKAAAEEKALAEAAEAREKEAKTREKEAKRREKEARKAAAAARKAERAEQKRQAEEAGLGSQSKRRRSTKCQGCKDDFEQPLQWSYWSQCTRCKLWWCGACTGCRCRPCTCAGEDCPCKCTCGGSKGRTCWSQHKVVCGV